MALERAATLVGLDEAQRAAFLAEYEDSSDLALLEDADITALFGDAFPPRKRRRLLSIRKYIYKGNTLDDTTTMPMVISELSRLEDVTANAGTTRSGIAAREDLLETVRAVLPLANWANTIATPLMSPGEFGRVEMQAAHAANIVIDFEGVENQPAVFSDAEIAPIAHGKEEQEVVAFFTLLLEPLVAEISERLVLLNCEEYQWLGAQSEISKYDKKPDLLLCHQCFFESREPSAAKPAADAVRTGDFKFGILANKCLQDSIGAVFEAKVKIGTNHTTFGEVINYGRLLALSGSRHQSSTWQHVVLFDKIEFWLFLFNTGALASVKRCSWTKPGSRQLFLDFISHESDWAYLLDAACDAFAVTGVSGHSFLGCGAFGRVFRVRRNVQDQDGAIADLALKIVLNSEAHNESAGNILRLEQDYLSRAGQAAPQRVPGVFQNVFDGPNGCALLLTKVGRPITNITAYFERVLLALVELHKLGIVHGDPRIANAIIVERGQINWIDFHMARFQEQSMIRFRQDMKILVKSFFVSSVGVPIPIPDHVGTALNGYEPQKNESVAVLSAAIKDNLQFA